MFYASLFAAINSMFLGVYVVLGYESLVVIFTIQLLSGIMKGVIWPVRSAFVKDLIDKPDQLVNAISLNSSMFNTAKIIGPALAAILIPLVGEGICFIINSLSYVAILISISLMNKSRVKLEKSKNSFFSDLSQGFQHAFSFVPIRIIILFVASIGFFGMSINVVLPIYAKEIIGGKADVYGFLTTFTGIGAIFSTFYIAARKNSYGLDMVILYATLVYTTGFFLLALTNQIGVALSAMIIIGIGQVAMFASANAIIQTIADEEKVGRVLSLYFTIFVGASILGNLVTGKITDKFGSQISIALIGFFNLVCVSVYASQIRVMRRKSLLRYARLNYLPNQKK
jgi:MFS family permease